MAEARRLTAPVDLLGEAPLWWEQQQTLLWVDLLGNKLHALPSDGIRRTWLFGENICWIIERRLGGFVAGFKSGFAYLELGQPGTVRICNPYPDEPENRLNDAKADSRGRIWAGSMHAPMKKSSGALYRLNPDETVEMIEAPYAIPNGPAFNRDESRMYHTESSTGEIWVYDLDAHGNVGNKRLFVKFPTDCGVPDGMTVDADDGLWVAHFGGSAISRFLPDGRLDRRISIPARQVTSLCFGGQAYERLFVTTAALNAADDTEAGAVFEIPPGALRGIRGLPARKFSG